MLASAFLPCLILWIWVPSLLHKPDRWPAGFWNFHLCLPLWSIFHRHTCIANAGTRTSDFSSGFWDLNPGHPACTVNNFCLVFVQRVISLALKWYFLKFILRNISECKYYWKYLYFVHLHLNVAASSLAGTVSRVVFMILYSTSLYTFFCLPWKLKSACFLLL